MRNPLYVALAIGLIALVLGLILKIHVLWIIGIVALVIGGVILLLDLLGVGPGRRNRV